MRQIYLIHSFTCGAGLYRFIIDTLQSDRQTDRQTNKETKRQTEKHRDILEPFFYMVELVHGYSIDHGDLAMVIFEDKDHVKVLQMKLNTLKMNKLHFIQCYHQRRLHMHIPYITTTTTTTTWYYKSNDYYNTTTCIQNVQAPLHRMLSPAEAKCIDTIHYYYYYHYYALCSKNKPRYCIVYHTFAKTATDFLNSFSKSRQKICHRATARPLARYDKQYYLAYYSAAATTNTTTSTTTKTTTTAQTIRKTY